MANEAHKEPTMEEILASIRKIISEDDASTAQRSGAPTEVREDAPVIDDDGQDDLPGDTFDAVQGDDLDEVMFEAETDDNYEVGEVEFDSAEDASESFEGLLDAARAVREPEPEPEPVFQPTPAPAPQPQSFAPVENDMSATARYQQTVLTDENTADAAAGSLGKLISKMDFGGNNTIEGLVRELLKPMIKEWLDANLPAIVEQKVEAEVQRIARMAR